MHNPHDIVSVGKGMFCLTGTYRVKSDNFGQWVNLDIHMQTVKVQMRQLLMSRLIRIFTVCLI